MLDLWNKTLQLDAENKNNFEAIAIETFQYQYNNNNIYRQFVDISKTQTAAIKSIADIPFLPISFFKTHTVLSAINEKDTPDFLTFESSGTTGSETSKHYVMNPSIYEDSFLTTFEQFYGDPSDYVFACLLPSYLERKNSSLVYMCNTLIQKSQNPESGFFLDNLEALNRLLQQKRADKKLFLIGVTFALLDFAAAYPQDLREAIIMETGGMKGRKEEQTRNEIHTYLKQQFQARNIHSEYGMTELLSQGYSKGNGIFHCPPFMKILIRDVNDPKQIQEQGSGIINVIDLANIHSCSFIATDDLGRVYDDGSFEVMGRIDHSALRGCALMAR